MKIAIVGAGWTGLTIAYLLSKLTDSKIDIYEKNNHIGGSSQDTVDPLSGVILPMYGAHIFHTENRFVWKFVNHFSEFNEYRHRVGILWKKNKYDWPITLDNLKLLLGVKDAEEAQLKLSLLGAQWKERQNENFETKMLSQLGPALYEIFIESYTKKMWGMEPSKLDARLAARTPIRLSNEKNLFLDRYQGMPKRGYHHLFEEMLNKMRNVKLNLKDDSYGMKSAHNHDFVFVTAPIDEWFSNMFGPLEYRGMRFENVRTRLNLLRMHNVGTLNTNSHPDVLRVEDPARYYEQTSGQSSILIYNFASGAEKFYPIPSAEMEQRASMYRNESKKHKRIIFCGRLGMYRYLNMDQAILTAIQAVEGITNVNVERYWVSIKNA